MLGLLVGCRRAMALAWTGRWWLVGASPDSILFLRQADRALLLAGCAWGLGRVQAWSEPSHVCCVAMATVGTTSAEERLRPCGGGAGRTGQPGGRAFPGRLALSATHLCFARCCISAPVPGWRARIQLLSRLQLAPPPRASRFRPSNPALLCLLCLLPAVGATQRGAASAVRKDQDPAQRAVPRPSAVPGSTQRDQGAEDEGVPAHLLRLLGAWSLAGCRCRVRGCVGDCGGVSGGQLRWKQFALLGNRGAYCCLPWRSNSSRLACMCPSTS